MNPKRLPIAETLFQQWQRARGRRSESASRPFSRVWAPLLENAGIESASEIKEAEADVKALANEGWLAIKETKYRNTIDSVAIPLEAESRWCDAFGFVPPSDEETRKIREFAWVPELSFVQVARLNLSFSELHLVNEFLKRGIQNRMPVPIKERSLEIFGDEKRLDQLLRGSALFAEGRLTPEMLGCFVVAEPLPWAPGAAPTHPVLVIENTATWHSYRQWNLEHPQFSAVVYGCGNRFVDSVTALADVFSAVGGKRRVFYFGDLDPRGLSIPQEASGRALSAGLPAIEPHLWSYRQLLTVGEGRSQAYEEECPPESLFDWLGELAEPARQLLSSGRRLPQEFVGTEFLRNKLNAT